MSAVIKDWPDLIKALEDHPEWRRELRRLVLSDELLELPPAFRNLEQQVAEIWTVLKEMQERERQIQMAIQELVAAQRRTDERFEELAEAQKRTEARVEQLAEAQKRTEKRVEELAEAQKRTEARVEQLAEAQKRTEARVEELASAMAELARSAERTQRELEGLGQVVRTLTSHVDKLRGWQLEYHHQRYAPAYFGPLLRRIHVLSNEEVARLVEDAEDKGLITGEEAYGVIKADVVCTGRLKSRPQEEVYAVAEVSWTISEEDVRRAAKRAQALQKALGKTVIPVVAGVHLDLDVAALAAMEGVYTLVQGKATAPEEFKPKPPEAD
ncbi:MAG: hypothetical protein ACP5NF_10125 [Thermoanaerobaculum sp.]